ncbi:MAG: cobalamin-dependent protein, partial [Deltaproteobacteria bacterium]
MPARPEALSHPKKAQPSIFDRLKQNRPKSVLLVPPTSAHMMSMSKWLHPNLGVERLASWVRKHGHYAETFDLNMYSILGTGQGRDTLTFAQKLKEKPWDVIGFSVYEATMVNDFTNMFAAEKLAPQALIIAGGAAAQFAYQTVLDKSPARVVVLGEGEKPLVSILEGKSLESIPGVAFRTQSEVLSGEEFAETTEGLQYEDLPYELYWDYYLKLYRESGADITPLLSKQVHTVRVYTRNYCPMNCT